jgi:hypothetical protein
MKLIKLLEIEIYKIKHHKLSKILLIGYFMLLSSIAFIASIQFKLGNLKIHLAEQGIFNFPYIWHFNTYIADIFTFFLSIIIVSTITNEYSYRTLKQNLIDGMSKKEFLLSKVLFVVLLSFLASIFVFIISLILGLIYSDYTSSGIIFSDLYFIPAFFLKLLGNFMFILFLGFLFKRSAFALGFFLIWLAIEKIIYGLIRWEWFNEETAQHLSYFFPVTGFTYLLPQPFTRLNAAKQIGKQIGQEISKFDGIPVYHFITAIIWIIAFYFFSFYLLKKRDL